MIYRIYSSLPSFKELRFRPDLNVLLAEKHEGASSKQTRNGAGKSSMVEIIHFLTAGECSQDSIFQLPELVGHTFGMEFDLGGQPVRVERSGKAPSDVRVFADISGWGIKPHDAETAEGGYALSVKEWDRLLGRMMFRFDELGPAKAGYAPTFRSLLSYFARRMPGGFTEPHLHFVGAKPAAYQVGISYLLGMDWTIAQEWQIVRDKEDEIKKLKAALGEGDLAELVGKKAELRSQVASSSASLQRMRERLEGFQVLPDFRTLEEEASHLAQGISNLSDENTIDRALMAQVGFALSDEKEPSIGDLEKMYAEAGVILQGGAVRRFDEVRKFHESVLSNRKQYLQGELAAAESRVARREREKGRLDERRREILQVLKSHGALDQFLKLQKEFGRLSAELEVLQKRFAAAEKIEEGLAKLKLRRQELFLRLQQDYAEQKENLNRAILYFEDVSAKLYEVPSNFTPTETPNGPQFRITFQAERS
ncbi:MAG: ABC-three component system protein, partial [Acidobacteriaceae bacterium]